MTTDNVILAGYAAQYPGELKVVGKGFSIENYGIGLKKGDTAGTATINAAIASMIADGSLADRRWRTRSVRPASPSRRRRPRAADARANGPRELPGGRSPRTAFIAI